MLCIVPSDDDKLAFLVEIENINDVETAGTIACARRANASPKNQSDNVDE
jgi:hypothetical protein